MIDTDKYEGMTYNNWKTSGIVLEIAVQDLLAEVKRLQRAWQILRSKTEMSCVCFTEYPDKQDMNTHELMDLVLKEASE